MTDSRQYANDASSVSPREAESETRLLRVVGVSVVVVLLVASLAVPASAQEQPTSEDALAAKEDAVRLRDDLLALDRAHPDLVDDAVIHSVNDSIAHGNTAYDLGKWGEAQAAYAQAAEKARGALRAYYPKATQTHLDVTEKLIGSYQDAKPGAAEDLNARLDQVRADLDNASSVAERRGVHERAAVLQEDAQDRLEPGLVEQLLDDLDLALFVGILFVGPLLGGLAVYRYLSQQVSDQPDETYKPYQTED